MINLVPLHTLFDIKYGVNQEFNKMDTSTKEVPFVGRSSLNNGVVGYVKRLDSIKPNPSNTISVSCGGSVMASFLQLEEYYSGRDLYYLKPKQQLTELQMLYYCMCLQANKYRYHFGRQANKTLKTIKVPSFDAIPNYVAEVLKKIRPPSKTSTLNKKILLDTHNWSIFSLKNLFVISGTKTTPMSDLLEEGVGLYPYVTTQATNNGIKGYFKIKTEKGNVLTIDSAVMGYCSYQKKDFSASDHVEKLKPKFTLNIYIAMFLTTILNNEQYRFNYGRTASQFKLKNLSIKLPATSDGKPDWQFMENYIKSLPYSKNLQLIELDKKPNLQEQLLKEEIPV